MGRRHTIPKTKPADKPKNKKKGSKKPVKEVHEEVKDNQQQEKDKYIGEYVMEQRNGCVFFLKQGEQLTYHKEKEASYQIPYSEPEIPLSSRQDEKVDPLDLDKFLWRDHSDFRQLSPAFKYDFLRTKTIAKEIIEGVIKELRNARDVYEISRCVQRCHIRTINTNFWEEKLQYMYNKSVLGDISEDDLVSAYITFSEFTESCYSKELTNSEDIQTASGHYLEDKETLEFYNSHILSEVCQYLRLKLEMDRDLTFQQSEILARKIQTIEVILQEKVRENAMKRSHETDYPFMF